MLMKALGILILDFGYFMWAPFPRCILPLNGTRPTVSSYITNILYYFLFLYWILPSDRKVRNIFPVELQHIVQSHSIGVSLLLRSLFDCVVYIIFKLFSLAENQIPICIFIVDILFSSSILFLFSNSSKKSALQKRAMTCGALYAVLFIIGFILNTVISNYETNITSQYTAEYCSDFLLETALHKQMLYLVIYVCIDIVLLCLLGNRKKKNESPKNFILLILGIYIIISKSYILPQNMASFPDRYSILDSDEIGATRYYFQRDFTYINRRDSNGRKEELYCYSSPCSLILDNEVIATVRVIKNARYHSCEIDGKRILFFGTEAILLPNETGGFAMIQSNDINQMTAPNELLSKFLLSRIESGELVWVNKSYIYLSTFMSQETEPLFSRYANGDFTFTEKRKSNYVNLSYIVHLAQKVLKMQSV